MSDFDDKLSAILADQNAMNQIMALAQSLSAPKVREGEELQEESCEVSSDVPACSDCQGQDVRLLAALRPYLKDSRQSKLDKALELLQIIRLLKGNRD